MTEDFSEGRAIEPEQSAKKIWGQLRGAWNDQNELLITMQELRETADINLLTKEQQRDLLFRLIEAAEQRGGVEFHDAIEIQNCFMPHGRSFDEPDAIDVYCEAMPEIWRRFPNSAHAISDLFDQDAQVAKPEVYFSTLAKLLRDPGLPREAVNGAVAGLSYQASFNLMPYLKRQVQQLETLSPEDAISLLTILDATATYGDGWSFSEASSQQLRTMIREYAAADTPTLLRRKAEALSKQRYTDLKTTIPSKAKINSRSFAGAVITPVSQEYLGVYGRDGHCYGLLPNTGGTEFSPSDVIDQRNIKALDTSGTSEEERNRRLQQQENYALLLDYNVLEGLRRDFQFPIEQLTLREQIWFAASLRNYRKTEEKTVQEFTKKFGLNGACAFLATEFGDHFRETVLHIGEQLPEEEARLVFEQFGEIVRLAEETAEDLGRKFFVDDKAYDKDAVRKDLLKKAQDFLVTVEGSDTQMIKKTLSQFQSDIVLFASMFKITQKGQEVKFEDIRGLSLTRKTKNELTAQEIDILEQTLRTNWSKRKPEATAELAKDLRERYQESQTISYYLLERNGRIVSFISFDADNPSAPNGVYADAFNVDPVLQSSGIGRAFLRNVLEQEAKNHDIYAHADPDARVLEMYTRDFGFTVIGEEADAAGNTWKKIKRSHAAVQGPHET